MNLREKILTKFEEIEADSSMKYRLSDWFEQA
jgi:hypothetical protein